ncbi:hypothetical protein LSCM1_01176 [Leishmania martiniquensis]|uniref:Uncharacterized protein n=1 Tax=Leishmania martiniquensis TaxID=1580590 RepID=A0A836GNB9_9TRYP|nr:hypothetical protein LSCM1_01176 [Leishmania martiniquensis]
MAHYGDPEAHRLILEEFSAIPAAPRFMAYLKAAVMGSQGSDVGLQQLRVFSDDCEGADPHLEVALALLSLTVLASKAHPDFRAQQKRVRELIERQRAALIQRAKRRKSSPCDSSTGARGSAAVPSTFASSTSLTALPIPFPSSGGRRVFAAAAASVAMEGREEKLTATQEWEQSMEILNYCEAYANYLGGFIELWYELFGPNYCYHRDVLANSVFDEGDDSDWEGARARSPEAGERTSPRSPRLRLPSSQRSHRQPHARRCQLSPCGPQVPPHLYAVRWSGILTPQRRAWFDGLHNVVKELLVRILHRELPLELYLLFIQYANLSLRVYLLQTLAEVFEWTSHCVDVIYYVHAMRQSYSIQCEMSQLQRMWSAFDLYDSRFLVDCREFNKMYTDSQGAFSEQREVLPSKSSTAARTLDSETNAAATTVALPTAVESGGPAQQSSRDGGGSGAREYPYTLAMAAASATAPLPDLATVGSGRLQRIFPSRDAAGSMSPAAAGAGRSTGSITPDYEALSSASEYEAAAAPAGVSKRAVYLPLFYTCCCFTWLLQRTFWSMYGRCSLLFESCLGIEVAPQMSPAAGPSETNGGDAPVLFTTAHLATRQRVSVAGSTGLPSLPASPSAPTPRVDSEFAARGGSAPTSVMSVTTTRNNVTTHRSALEVPSRDGYSVSAAGGLLQAPQTHSCGLPSPIPSGQQATFSAEAASRHARPHVVVDGAGAEAAAGKLTRQTAASAPVDEKGREKGAATSWVSALGRLLQRGQRRPCCEAAANSGARDAGDMTSTTQCTRRVSSLSLAVAPGASPPLSAAADDSGGGVRNSLLLENSGAPFHLQYTHRTREIQLYEDPSVTFTNASGDGKDANTLFFEEFYFLRETGCYVLSHAVRSLTCYPRYPATLLILTDNTTRPGRISWRNNKFSVLSFSGDDGDGRQGLMPWVLCAVIPHTRLSSVRSVRARQEKALLKHIVFQVAGSKSSRVSFCTSNSIFFVLNSGGEMDGGRLYFALHLHVDQSALGLMESSIDRAMKLESQWAFRALGELHVSWAMSCTCNEALRVASRIGSGEAESSPRSRVRA